MSTVANTLRIAGGKPRKSTRPWTFIDYFCFITPCVVVIQFNLIGALNLTDIILLLAFISLVLTGRIRVESPRARNILILGFLWLGSQILTDIVRHSVFADYARGWSSIGLTLINLCVLMTLLYRKPRRLMLFGTGFAIAYLGQFFLFPQEVQVQYAWKFGLSYPLSMVVALWVSRKECKGNTPIILLTVFGVFVVFTGARSAGGICVAAALYLAMNQYIARKTAGGVRLKTGFIVMMVFVFTIGTVAVLSLYSYASAKGYLGEEAGGKFEQQSSGKYGVLLGGRIEMLGAIPAIIDSPILGHGSWAKEPKYTVIMRQALAYLDYEGALDMSKDELVEGLIPSHSFLLGAWVYAGVLGAFFWGWIWIMIVRSLLRVYPPAANLLPLMAFVSFVLLWDILFSPFGTSRRAQVSYYLVLIISYYDTAVKSAALLARARATSAIKPFLSSKKRG